MERRRVTSEEKKETECVAPRSKEMELKKEFKKNLSSSEDFLSPSSQPSIDCHCILIKETCSSKREEKRKEERIRKRGKNSIYRKSWSVKARK